MMFILKQQQVTFPPLPPYRLEVELSITVVVNNLAYHILLSHAHTRTSMTIQKLPGC